MRYEIFILIGLVAILVTGCCAPLGPNKYNFTDDNATTCRDKCLDLQVNKTCAGYTYEWNKYNSTTEQCDCLVNFCSY